MSESQAERPQSFFSRAGLGWELGRLRGEAGVRCDGRGTAKTESFYSYIPKMKHFCDIGFGKKLLKRKLHKEYNYNCS